VRRFLGVFGAVAVLSGVLAATAAALAFTDASYFTPEGVVGRPYEHRFDGHGGCGPGLPYQYRILNGALPPGLTLSSSGYITGVPTQAGKYDFWVELSDQNPPTASWCRPETAEREFSINVIPGVAITTPSVGPGTVAVAYNAALQADLPGPKSWSVVEGTLPPGLSIGATDGVISGTPTTVGSYVFVVRVDLDAKRWDRKGFKIDVRDPVAATATGLGPTIPSEVGVAFKGAVTATGGTGPGTYVIALAGGSLPPGVLLGPDGTISGKPTTAGKYAFQISVTDAEGRVATVISGIVVKAKLSMLTLRLGPGRVGKLYRGKVIALGGVAPTRFRIASGALPPGVKLNPLTGALLGVPLTAGTYRFTVQATDALKVRTAKFFTLVVAPAPKK
jgi:hypothetical protein